MLYVLFAVAFDSNPPMYVPVGVGRVVQTPTQATLLVRARGNPPPGPQPGITGRQVNSRSSFAPCLALLVRRKSSNTSIHRCCCWHATGTYTCRAVEWADLCVRETFPNLGRVQIGKQHHFFVFVKVRKPSGGARATLVLGTLQLLQLLLLSSPKTITYRCAPAGSRDSATTFCHGKQLHNGAHPRGLQREVGKGTNYGTK